MDTTKKIDEYLKELHFAEINPDNYAKVRDAAWYFEMGRLYAFEQNMEGVTVYCPVREMGKLKFVERNRASDFPRTEFEDNEISQYAELYQAMYSLTEKIDPDIVLRTTPVFLWGIDELMPVIMKRLNMSERLRCYQECYCAGKALSDGENEVASVGCGNMAVLDEMAAANSTVPNTVAIGYLNARQFQEHRFADRRRVSRKQLALNERDKAFLYVASCIYDIAEELYHFEVFLKQMTGLGDRVKLYLKFHPRHSETDRNKYAEAIDKSECSVTIIDQVEYLDLLAFPDCMVSLASSVNIDAVNYRSFYYEEAQKTFPFISIYPYGPRTASVLRKIYGTENYPSYDKEGYHLVVSEEAYVNEVEQVIREDEVLRGYEERYKKNHKNFVDSADRLIEYLNNACY